MDMACHFFGFAPIFLSKNVEENLDLVKMFLSLQSLKQRDLLKKSKWPTR